MIARILILHVGNVENSMSFICKECSKVFSVSSILKTHLRTHSGEKSFDCKECFKLFSHSGSLNKHLITYSGERSFVCKVCSKSFSTSDNLNTHLRTHSGERGYLFVKNVPNHFLKHPNLKPTVELNVLNHFPIQTILINTFGEKPFICKD